MTLRLLLLGALGLLACRRETSWDRSAGRQLQQWCLADAGDAARALSALTGVPSWNRLFFVTPYSTPAEVAAAHHFTWSGGDLGMSSRDDAHLALFVSGDKVVQVEEWSMGNLKPSAALSQRPFLTPAESVRCGEVSRGAVTLEPARP